VRQLRRQKLAIGIGVALGVALTLAVSAVVLVLVGGRESKKNVAARPVPRSRVFHTLRTGDVARAPLAATRCEASAEGGTPNLFCTRILGGRYQVVFYKDVVLIFRVGDPDNPRAVSWKP
jgi:hypothetical protein